MSAKLIGLADAFAGIESEIAADVTGGMRLATEGLKEDLRDQVRKAGLGTKLANTWRGQVYPAHQDSLDPAGVVWSKAPKLLDAFDRNPNIVPVNGAKMLAIPTKNVPRQSARRLMTPVEVEATFNQDLIITRGRNGHLYAYVNVVAAKNKRGFRAPTKGRLKQGREVKLVMMFVLVRSVRPGKRVDIDTSVNTWTARLPGLVNTGR
ncbi:hypothetical protein AEAC466_17360 [Asticcacaulis sp. AC466]|uniref:DUF6441 family protein n=1 Tax=Asticcacaulis sp. AC466 TaxID=1282362 RepID=UPI0003C3D5A4|nr:DUF6441 family protein [Asticcacaulis sp. AC466]ESQ82391.1 hypothetical protein AEAC466_17360 [Asticcacaulis sp. AC466]